MLGLWAPCPAEDRAGKHSPSEQDGKSQREMHMVGAIFRTQKSKAMSGRGGGRRPGQAGAAE